MTKCSEALPFVLSSEALPFVLSLSKDGHTSACGPTMITASGVRGRVVSVMLAAVLTVPLSVDAVSPPVAAQSPRVVALAPGLSAVSAPMRDALAALERIRPDVRVGEWVTFGLDAGGGRQSFLRLAVVGEEPDAKGRPAYWLEMDLGDHASLRAPLAQFRMLVTRSLGLTRDGISRLFVAMAHAPPQELAPSAVATLLHRSEAPSSTAASSRKSAELVVRHGQAKRVMTSAGTLEATPIDFLYRQTVVQRLWLSPLVPVLPVARLEMPAVRQTLEVREYGLDARPQMRLPDPTSPKIQLEPGDTPP